MVSQVQGDAEQTDTLAHRVMRGHTLESQEAGTIDEKSVWSLVMF